MLFAGSLRTVFLVIFADVVFVLLHAKESENTDGHGGTEKKNASAYLLRIRDNGVLKPDVQAERKNNETDPGSYGNCKNTVEIGMLFFRVEIIDIGIAPAVVLMADAGYYQDIYGNSDQYEQDNACNGFAYDSVQRGDDCDRKNDQGNGRGNHDGIAVHMAVIACRIFFCRFCHIAFDEAVHGTSELLAYLKQFFHLRIRLA